MNHELAIRQLMLRIWYGVSKTVFIFMIFDDELVLLGWVWFVVKIWEMAG